MARMEKFWAGDVVGGNKSVMVMMFDVGVG